jgi:hypothetical protein
MENADRNSSVIKAPSRKLPNCRGARPLDSDETRQWTCLHRIFAHVHQTAGSHDRPRARSFHGLAALRAAGDLHANAEAVSASVRNRLRLRRAPGLRPLQRCREHGVRRVLAYRTADRRYRQALRSLSTRTTVMPRGIENAPRAGAHAHAHGAPAPREPFLGSVTVMAMMTPVSFSSASGAISGLSVKPRSASRRMTISSSGMSLL